MKNNKKLWKNLVECGKINGSNLFPFRSGSLKYAFDFKEIGESVDFCTVKAEGFKTACASISFMLPLSEDASLFALIPNILTRSSEKYPTLTLLERKLATLYGAEIGVDVSKIAISFNGGGHARAAGYTMEDDLDIGKNKVIDVVGVMLGDDSTN